MTCDGGSRRDDPARRHTTTQDCTVLPLGHQRPRRCTSSSGGGEGRQYSLTLPATSRLSPPAVASLSPLSRASRARLKRGGARSVPPATPKLCENLPLCHERRHLRRWRATGTDCGTREAAPTAKSPPNPPTAALAATAHFHIESTEPISPASGGGTEFGLAPAIGEEECGGDRRPSTGHVFSRLAAGLKRALPLARTATTKIERVAGVAKLPGPRLHQVGGAAVATPACALRGHARRALQHRPMLLRTARERTTASSTRTKPSRRLGGGYSPSAHDSQSSLAMFIFLCLIVSAELIGTMGVG